MMKLITLTLNPAFDLHCHIPTFAPYRENLAQITDYGASGKGVNISRALCVCGVENTALVVVGEENGEAFLQRLAEDGMTCQSITVPGRIRENITIHTDHAPETRISFEGFETDASLAARVYDVMEGVIDGDTVVTLTGRTPKGLSVEAVKNLLRAMKEQGARIVIDSKSFGINDLLEVKPWLIKPNEEEISEYLGRPVRSFEEVTEAAEVLWKQGIENVMISLGEQGAMLVCAEGRYIATPPKVAVISTIGAGDSSIAGFLAAAREGESKERTLRRAVAYGSAACMTEGTRPPRKEDVEEIFERMEIKKL